MRSVTGYVFYDQKRKRDGAIGLHDSAQRLVVLRKRTRAISRLHFAACALRGEIFVPEFKRRLMQSLFDFDRLAELDVPIAFRFVARPARHLCLV